MINPVLNEEFSSGLTQPGQILDYFPYLSKLADHLTRQS
jgi:hypothetical protein